MAEASKSAHERGIAPSEGRVSRVPSSSRLIEAYIHESDRQAIPIQRPARRLRAVET